MRFPLITDSGEVRSVDLNASTSVRIAEKDLQVEVGRYLGLIASSRDQDVRRMTISTTGTGERNLYVSYISEVPIWRRSLPHRAAFQSGKETAAARLGHRGHTVGEMGQRGTLAGGRSAALFYSTTLGALYGRRPVVPLPESVQLSPQTHAATLMRGNGRLNGAVTDNRAQRWLEQTFGCWMKIT